VGGIGGGMFLALEGTHTLGREESRGARLLDVRDACKLHIVAHHVAVLLGADPSGTPFHVVPVGDVGDDDAGRWAVAEMVAAGMDTRHVRVLPDRPTLFSVCFQYPDGSGGNITTLDSAAAALTEADVEAVGPLLAAGGPRTIALAAPEVGLAQRRRLLELGRGHGAFGVASFVSGEVAVARDEGILALADLVALNADEAAALTGRPFDPDDPSALVDAVYPASLVVTAGVRGAWVFAGGRSYHRTGVAVDVASSAGAGDALLAGVLVALASGVPLLPPEGVENDAFTCALDLGVLLASLSVTSPHTIHPGADLDAVIRFADDHGIALGPSLADVL
jgi:ribokinase